MSKLLATVAVGVMAGVLLAAGFSALLVTRTMSFEATLTFITVGSGLIGVWLLLCSASPYECHPALHSRGWASPAAPD